MTEKEGMKVKGPGSMYFNVKHCPQDTFARFHKYCDDVSKDAGLNYASYPLGIKSLLDNVKFEEIEESEKDSQEGIKTFGKK